MDEIGEMAYDLQSRLLRVLETGEYIKIGDTKPTKVDVRIISATNRDLKKEIDNGNFREDLYFRLSVFRSAYLLCGKEKMILKVCHICFWTNLPINLRKNYWNNPRSS